MLPKGFKPCALKQVQSLPSFAFDCILHRRQGSPAPSPGAKPPPMLCPVSQTKKLLPCDPAFLQVQGLHATRLHTKRLIARLKRACTAGRGSHAWRPSSKLEPSNFCKILAFLCEKFWKFSTRVDLDLQASRMF